MCKIKGVSVAIFTGFGRLEQSRRGLKTLQILESRGRIESSMNTEEIFEILRKLYISQELQDSSGVKTQRLNNNNNNNFH